MKIKYLGLNQFSDSVSYSALDVVNEKFYLLAGDSDQILITDSKRKFEDRFGINYEFPKESSPVSLNKISAVFISSEGKTNFFFALHPTEPKGIKTNLKQRSSELLDLSVFYSRIKSAGVNDLTIHAACLLNDKVILSISSSAENPGGQLIVTDSDFFEKQESADLQLVKLQWGKKEPSVNVCAIQYSYENDWLMVAGNVDVASPADTPDTQQDIFLGVIENAYRKIGRKRIRIQEMFDLKQTDQSFDKQKIVSIVAPKDKKDKLKIYLLGNSTPENTDIFSLRLKD